VPVIFAQPNIITSRITPTFVYDSRQPSANGIDTLRGTQISASFAFSGLGGDVRTYQPSITYTNFIPVRRKRSQNAEVFGFRIQAGTIGSFGITDNIRNANSLAFVGGVPLYERYFLGSEYDLRGYTSRAIGPIAPYDSFITSRNVRIASNVSGTPMIPAALSSDIINELTPFGTFTGATGANAAALNRDFRFIGGDTQLLGNFEYRIPIFGPVSLAAFADVGTVFNLRKTGIQTINSEFLDDDTFVGAGTLTALLLRNNPVLEGRFGSLLLFNDRLLTTQEFRNLFCQTAVCPTSPPVNVQQLFIRGEAQTNSLLRVDEAAFNRFGDFRSSVGLELRVQVPVVNVPFRLIYYYNPNAKIGRTEELPGCFCPASATVSALRSADILGLRDKDGMNKTETRQAIFLFISHFSSLIDKQLLIIYHSFSFAFFKTTSNKFENFRF
jgi:outer membrane protein insertion porin family